MSLNTRQKLLLAKIESTYGTDSVPAAADAIRTNDFQSTPLVSNQVERNFDSATHGSSGSIHTDIYRTMSFGVEMAGSGAAGTAPGWGTLLRACGWSETVTASTDVQYDPISSSFESMSGYAFLDGDRRRYIGSRGTMGFSLAKSALPLFNFEFWGAYSAATRTAEPSSPDFSAFQTPIPASKDNTPTVTIDGRSATCGTFQLVSFDFTQGNRMSNRNLPGCSSIEIVDRAPTGRLVLTAEGVDVKDWVEASKDADLFAMNIIHGTAAGNILEFDGYYVQATNATDGDDDGVRTIELDLSFTFDSGDDEYKITQR